MDDEQLRSVAAPGGVVHMVALGGYVNTPPQERQQALQQHPQDFDLPAGRRAEQAIADMPADRRAQYDARLATIDERWPWTPPDVADFVNHIDHAVSVIGIDHVGISSDFDGGGGIIGWNDASETFNVTLELVRRGYSEEDIRKIWGGNLLRAWRELERVARELQAEG